MKRNKYKNLTWLLLVVFGLVLPASLPAVEQFPPHEMDIEVDEEEIKRDLHSDIPLEILPDVLPPEQPFDKESEEEPEFRAKKRLKRRKQGKSDQVNSGMILKRMDLNDDGVVDLHEIHVMLKKHGISEKEMDELALKLMEYDEDEDEALSKEELKTMRNDKPKLMREFLSRRPRFKEKFDFNQNGTIDDQEWDQIREARKRFSDRRKVLRGRQMDQPHGRFKDHSGSRPPLRGSGEKDFSPEGMPPHQKGNFTTGSRFSEKTQVSSPAQVAAQIHENIVKVFQTTARRLEKGGDLNRALIVQAKLAEVEVHLAKALIRIQEKDYDEAVNELNNIVKVARSLPDIGPLPEIQKEEAESKQKK